MILAGMDVAGCLGCDLLAGRRDLPGGIVYETAWWVVNHAVGPLNLGTLIVGPREHVTAVADLDDRAAAELGPVLRDTARVVEAICRPEQTYTCLWSHGPAPVEPDVIAERRSRAPCPALATSARVPG